MKLEGYFTAKDHEGLVESTSLVADLVEPEGSLVDQENEYGIPVLENMAFVTVTLIMTPDDEASKSLFGENTIVYFSPTPLAGFADPKAVIASRKSKKRTCLGMRSRN